MFARLISSRSLMGSALTLWFSLGCAACGNDPPGMATGPVSYAAGTSGGVVHTPSPGASGRPAVLTGGPSSTGTSASSATATITAGTSGIAGRSGVAGSLGVAAGSGLVAGTSGAAGRVSGAAGASGASMGTSSIAGVSGSSSTTSVAGSGDGAAGSAGTDDSSGNGTRDPNGPCKDLDLFCFDPIDMFIFNPECATCNNGMGCQDCVAFQAI
jgi:hypothetical protein